MSSAPWRGPLGFSLICRDRSSALAPWRVVRSRSKPVLWCGSPSTRDSATPHAYVYLTGKCSQSSSRAVRYWSTTDAYVCGSQRWAGERCGRVELGGHLTDRKGVNVPGVVLPLAALSAKDRADLDRALELQVDWIALSFVQRPEDVAAARQIVAGRAGVMAKLEKPAAIDQLDAIIELADALMVARGDLGVELPLEYVPGRQKQIIRAARRAGKPVVVATQMLESMITNAMPTRAEVSDVATAVFEGADAVMLSAESAIGQYPVEAVGMMDRIACSVESDPYYRSIIDAQRNEPEATTPDAIMAAARQVVQTLQAAAIVSWTSSGSTGLRAARERPSVPIIALTPVQGTGRRLALVWGLHCVVTEDAQDFEDMVERACRIACREGFAAPEQSIVITAGVPLGTPGATNLLRIARIGRHAGSFAS